MKTRHCCSGGLVIVIITMLCFPAWAVPGLINYQGMLVDQATGTPITDPGLAMTFRIYDAATGGTLLWEEEHASVPVDNGSYTVLLGSGTTIYGSFDPDLFSEDNRWLEVEVDGEIFDPMLQITSVAFSMKAGVAEAVEGGAITTVMIADGAVETDKLANDAISGAKIASDQVTSAHLVTGAVGISEMADNAIGSAEIIDGSVTAADLADKYVKVSGDTMTDGLTVIDASGNDAVKILADGTASAGEIELYDTSGTQLTMALRGADATSSGSEIVMYNASGVRTVELDGDWTTTGGGSLGLADSYGLRTIHLDADHNGTGYSRITTDGLTINNGDLGLKNDSGLTTIYMDADYWGTGDGWIITNVLSITGGSDLSEQFDIEAIQEEIKAGMVVSIDPQRPGKLLVSKAAYDNKVAGIVSGAGGVKPGMMMGQKGSVADGVYPVALTGRVYCWADTSNGAIQPGDLLTTSNVPGHAMKATDRDKAFGATIGKAMTPLGVGKGLVLVLVSLQ